MRGAKGKSSKKAATELVFDLQVTFTPTGKSKKKFNLKAPGSTTFAQLKAMLQKETRVSPENQKILCAGKNLAADKAGLMMDSKPITVFFGKKKKKVRLLLMDASKALEKAQEAEAAAEAAAVKKAEAAAAPAAAPAQMFKKPKPMTLEEISQEAQGYSERASALLEQVAVHRSKGAAGPSIRADLKHDFLAFNRLTQLLEILDRMKMDDRQQYDAGGGRELIRNISRVADQVDNIQQSLKE